MRNLFRAENGPGMVEYGLIFASIVIVVFAVFPPLGRWASSMLDQASDAIATTTGG